MRPDTAKALDATITSLKRLRACVERDHEEVAETYVPRDVCERNTLRNIFATTSAALGDLEHTCRHAAPEAAR